VVADALQLGDDVRGQQHGEAVGGDRVHQRAQKVAAGQRIQVGHGLVQDQQPGTLGQRQRQRDLGLLASR